MAEEILNVGPEELTDRDCLELSADNKLKQKYEKKWNTKGVCEYR